MSVSDCANWKDDEVSKTKEQAREALLNQLTNAESSTEVELVGQKLEVLEKFEG